MLQIKNTLGGGKPEGLYAWKKNNYAFTEKSTSGMVANTFITTEAQNKSIRYYYSSSYSYDDNTGMFVLENPTSDTIPYEAGVSPSANVYITVFSPSSEIMIKTSSTSGKSTLYNVSAGVYFHIANANYPYTLFESETILSFIDYIVSDKETAYPDGGEKGGYWYERVGGGITPEMFGYTKMAIDKYTPTSDTYTYNVKVNHSLGEIPKRIIILVDMNDFQQDISGNYLVFADIALSPNEKYMSSISRCSSFNSGNYPWYGGYSEGAVSTSWDTQWNITSKLFIFQTSASFKYKAGTEYTIISMA